MLTKNSILKQLLLLVLLPLLIISSCKKPETVLPEGPKSINVEATVPVLIYSNVKDVYMDARRTISLNSKREMFFNWSCTLFPGTAGRPVIIDSARPSARLQNPGIGQYVFKLTVKDNLGNMAVTNYTMDVLEDTLAGKKPVAQAGPDKQITAPKHEVTLDAYESFDLNAKGRSLRFKWTVFQKPVADNLFEIINDTFPIAKAWGLIEGIYKIQLEVIGDNALSALDTMEIKVLPDPLKGTTQIIEDVVWEFFPGPFWDIVAIQIKDPGLFADRYEANMELSIWDTEKKEWSDSKKYYWEIYEPGGVMIYYPFLGDGVDYYKMVGVKTRVRVKFL